MNHKWNAPYYEIEILSDTIVHLDEGLYTYMFIYCAVLKKEKKKRKFLYIVL